jgi:hypothetical protein
MDETPKHFTLGKGYHSGEEDCEKFYELKLPMSSIHMIDTIEKLGEMTNYLFQVPKFNLN